MIVAHRQPASIATTVPPPPSSQEILSAIPPAQLAKVRSQVSDRMVPDVIREIRRGVPAYAQPLDSPVGRVLVSCVERAVHQVADGIGNPSADHSEWERWFRYIGRLEYQQGRSTDALQAAVRIGTRVGWRHVQAAGTALGAPAGTLYALADALFQYADDLSAAAIAGYDEAKARATGDLAQRRYQLLKLIIADPPISPQAIVELAELSDWPVPERVAVVALDRLDDPHPPAANFDPRVLADLYGTEPCLVLPDPDRQVPGLPRVLGDRPAAVGPFVPIAEAARSLACARRALSLAQRGLLGAGTVIRCADHLPALAMFADEFVLAQLSGHALRPFAQLTGKQRERLSETLLAWLGSRGGINEVADRLGVHPQTVRYRMNQVAELLGDRLDDPDERLMLDIALRAEQGFIKVR